MRTILLSLMIFTLSYAATSANSTDNNIYNFKYSPIEGTQQIKNNIFLNGNFDSILRYDSLYFNGKSLESDSQKNFNTIKKKIHEFTNDKTHEIIVSVVAYTQKVVNKNQEIKLDTSYTNFFQSIAQRDNKNKEDASNEAVNSMQIIYDEMLDNNISKEIIYRENCTGKANLYSEEFSEGRSKNNRINITIYVKKL